MQQVRLPSGLRGAFCRWHPRSFHEKWKPIGFQPGFPRILQEIQGYEQEQNCLLDRHEIFPGSIYFLYLKHKG